MRQALQRPIGMWIFVACLGLVTFSPISAQAPKDSAIIHSDPPTFRNVVKSALPAVVTIETRSSRRGNQMRVPVEDQEAPEDLRKFFEGVEPRQSRNEPQMQSIGFGSGFIVDPKGIVLTNNHVIQHAEQIEITLSDGRKFKSKEIKSDRRTDLAIIRLDTKGERLPYLELGDSSQMEIGDRVLAIGAPYKLSGSVTHGIISAKGREIDERRNGTPAQYGDFLQTDAAINPGNSGGPLVNMEGKVIGVTSAIRTESGGFEGLAFAISSNVAKTVMQQLINEGVVHRGYLGINLISTVSSEAAKFYGAADGGAIVDGVREKSPAGKAGIKIDDVITSINGKPITNYRDLQRIVLALPVKSTVDVSILREGKPMTVKVTLEEEPKGSQSERRNRGLRLDSERYTSEKSGLTLADMIPSNGDSSSITHGAVVTKVERKSAANDAGLTSGMIIYRVNRTPVENAVEARDAINAALAKDGKVLLHVQKLSDDGSSMEIYMLKGN